MPKVTADQLCRAMEGKLIQGRGDTRIRGIMTRCLEVVPGLIYFDVRGGQGGNINIQEAVKNGAVGVVISKHKKILPFEDKNIAVITVPRVWEAFWKVVKFYRDMHDIPVVGVTGTSGKTTTKEMVTSIFRRRWKTLKTVGNLNLPDFVPSHIMRLKWGYEAAVFEIGMNRPGHISKQARVIQPKVGIITHIGPGHVEHLGSLENVILEKAGILQGIPDDGFLILNADDVNTKRVDVSGFKGRIIYYGLKNKAHYTAHSIKYNERGTSFKAVVDGKTHDFFIPTFGRHNVSNALAAIAAARVFDFNIDMIKLGLARYRKPKMRLQVVKGIRGSLVLNDCYNANPDSVCSGLEVLAALGEGRTSVAVLGNMLEQGQYSVQSHRMVGRKAAELKIDWLVTVGQLAKEILNGAACGTNGMKKWSFRLKKQALDFLRKELPENSVVLVKGSRGAYMERLVRGMMAVPPGSCSSKT